MHSAYYVLMVASTSLLVMVFLAPGAIVFRLSARIKRVWNTLRAHGLIIDIPGNEIQRQVLMPA